MIFNIFNNSFSTGIDQSEWMLVPTAPKQGSGGPPGVPDVTLLGVGSWGASVSFRGTTGLDGMVVWGTWGLEAMAILPTGRVVLQ